MRGLADLVMDRGAVAKVAACEVAMVVACEEFVRLVVRMSTRRPDVGAWACRDKSESEMTGGGDQGRCWGCGVLADSHWSAYKACAVIDTSLVNVSGEAHAECLLFSTLEWNGRGG